MGNSALDPYLHKFLHICKKETPVSSPKCIFFSACLPDCVCHLPTPNCLWTKLMGKAASKSEILIINEKLKQSSFKWILTSPLSLDTYPNLV